VGPVIDAAAAERIESWIKEAVDGGAEVLVGGGREGNLVQPTVLSSLKPEMSVSCREAFAPLVGLYRYSEVRDAISSVNAGDFGLQAGVFTEDWRVIRAAFDGIEVGGLIVNDVPTFRIDHMPYGGVKRSGAGREGLRYAIEEMSELKLLVVDAGRTLDGAP
jgi:acyl-CoA reductase-like NAD-dependent aldehyde dehydrogenase